MHAARKAMPAAHLPECLIGHAPLRIAAATRHTLAPRGSHRKASATTTQQPRPTGLGGLAGAMDGAHGPSPEKGADILEYWAGWGHKVKNAATTPRRYSPHHARRPGQGRGVRVFMVCRRGRRAG